MEAKLIYILIQIFIPLIIIIRISTKPGIFFKKNWDVETIEKNKLRFKKMKWLLIISAVMGVFGIVLMKAGSS